MLNNTIFDVIVVGSGLAGVHVACPIVDAGYTVALIDGGVTNPNYQSIENDFIGDFEYIRRHRNDQYRLFLGEALDGILPKGATKSHSSAMTEGNRAYISKQTDEFLPIVSTNVNLLQSLAKGGFSECWGAVCDIFSDEELNTIGIPPQSMKHHYQTVINKIGVAGHLNDLKTIPPIEVDSNASIILNNSKRIKNDRFYIERSSLAILTKQHNGRFSLEYDDLEFWLNRGGAIYRSRFTLEELQTKTNFTYLPGFVVSSIVKKGGRVHICAQNIRHKNITYFSSTYCALAAGALNSSRILFRSMNCFEKKVPFIVKDHLLIPCILFRSIGKPGNKKRCSFAQLVIKDYHEIDGCMASFAQLYSYKSLLLFKLLNYSPLPAPETLRLLSLYAPAFMIADVRFPSFQQDTTSILLRAGENNTLPKIILENSSEPKSKHLEMSTIKNIKKLLFTLGLCPLKIVRTPFGSSAHYAGGVPISSGEKNPFSVDRTCMLHQNDQIYVADAATWNALPAKPPGLTIMANANRVGHEIVKRLTGGN